MSKGIIHSDDFELRYSIEGKGPVVLVVGSAVYYPRTFSASLRRSFKFVFVDHRGFARCSRVPTREDFRFEKILEDIELVRKKLQLGRVIIMGHSGHGYMALEYAKRFPESVSRVVIIATGASHNAADAQLGERHWQEAVCPERKAKLAQDLEKLNEEIAARPESRFITFCIRLGAKSWFDHNFDAAPLWAGVEVNMTGMDYLWGEVFRDLDVGLGLNELQAPVLLIMGRFDYLVAPAASWDRWRSSFRSLTVRIFDRSAHTPQLEEGENFDSELIDWLGKDPV